MNITMNSKNIDLNNVYFGFEAGRYYDSENNEFCTFVDNVMVEKTNFTAIRNGDIIYFYVNVLNGKSYLLDNTNKILDNDDNIINNRIEDMISVADLFKQYMEINKVSNEDDYISLINMFEGQDVVSRKLFNKSIGEIINLKNYIYEYNDKEFKDSFKSKVRKI